MSKMPVFLILLFLASAVPAGLAPRTARLTLPKSRQADPLLRDGFILVGVDGTLAGPDSPAPTSPIGPWRPGCAGIKSDADCQGWDRIGEVGAGWFFELASDVNDSSSVVKAGTKLELLPSSALEKMIADAKTHPAATYRLWDGRVTRYKGRNFIFPNYFQPLRRPALSAAEGTQDARRPSAALP